MKNLAILLIFSLIPAMSFSEEELIYKDTLEGDGSYGAMIAVGLMTFDCKSLLYNFDITQTNKNPKHKPNTEEDEFVLRWMINSFLDALNYSAWQFKKSYGRRTDTDTDEYKVSRLINDCKKDKYKDGRAFSPLINYYNSLPAVTIEDMPEKYRPE